MAGASERNAYIHVLYCEGWCDGHSGGDTPGPIRTRKLSPPTFHAVLRCASPREPWSAVSHFLSLLFNATRIEKLLLTRGARKPQFINCRLTGVKSFMYSQGNPPLVTILPQFNGRASSDINCVGLSLGTTRQLTTLTPTRRSISRCVLPWKKACVDCTKTEIGARAALIRPRRQRRERRWPQNPTNFIRGSVKLGDGYSTSRCKYGLTP